MKKNILKLSVVILFICIAAFVIWTRQHIKKESGDILTAFKKTDSALAASNDSLRGKQAELRTNNSDASYQAVIDLSFKVNKISLRIDTLKNDLRVNITTKNKNTFFYKNKASIIALKADLLDYNLFIQKHFSDKSTIVPADLINIADINNGSALVPWEIYYFENTNMYSVSTVLTFIKQRVFKLQQKAIYKN